MKKNDFILLLLCVFTIANAKKDFRIPDSLSNKDYSYFDVKINYKDSDSIEERLYAHSWLAKAKAEKNYAQMSAAYKSLMYTANKIYRLQYADSTIIAAKHTNDPELIGSAYMTNGIVNYDRKELIKALDNFIIAEEYISKTNNKYLIYKLKYAKALTKYYLGYYHEAISLLKQCVTYFKEVNDHAYLNSLYSLGQCYSHIHKYQQCSEINELGLREAENFKISKMKTYFLFSEGINQSFKHNYNDANKKLSIAVPFFKSNKNFANETLAYFYIGKNYWSQNQKEKAVLYFKKVDTTFQKKNYISPDLREAYEFLIDYYSTLDDKESQLNYVKVLLKVDKLLEHNYKYLSEKITKTYDTEKLLKSQLDLEKSMNTRTLIGAIVISIMSSIIAVLIYRHFRSKRLFKELMQRSAESRKTLVSSSGNDTKLDIPYEVVEAIIKKLEKFELNKKYLENDMNLNKFGSILETNSKYASKIIGKYRNKRFIEYISDLKIDHIVQTLKTEKKYRQYTNKALAEEIGFGSTQNFTRAFNSRTGISPTYFVKELNKTK